MAAFLKSFGKSSSGGFIDSLIGGLMSAIGTTVSGAFNGGWKGIAKAWKNKGKASTGSGLTDADKEAAALSLKNQQELNQQEYDRKIDFYERFESPEAQVRQHKEAGLNPMLLAGGGASVSASGGIGAAGSSDVPNPPDPSQMLGDALGVTQMLMNYRLRDREIKLQEDYNPVRIEVGQKQAAKLEQDIKVSRDTLPLQVEQLRLNNDNLRQTLANEKTKGEILKHGVTEAEARAAITVAERVMKEMDAGYHQRFIDLDLRLKDLNTKLVSAQISGQYAQIAKINADIAKIEDERVMLGEDIIGKMTQNDHDREELRIFMKYAEKQKKREVKGLAIENTKNTFSIVWDGLKSIGALMGN